MGRGQDRYPGPWSPAASPGGTCTTYGDTSRATSTNSTRRASRGDPAPAAARYAVRAWIDPHDPDWWVLDVPALRVDTRVRWWHEVEPAARALIATTLRIDIDDVGVDVWDT